MTRAPALGWIALAFLPLAACDLGQPRTESRATWMIEPTVDLLDVQALAPDLAVAVGRDGSLLKRWRNGRQETLLPAGTGIRAVWAQGQSPVAVDRPGMVWRQEGGRWTRSWGGASAVNDIWGSAADDVFIVGDRGSICRFDGTRWAQLESGTDADLLAVAGRGPDEVYAAGSGHEVVRWDGAGCSLEPVAGAHSPFTALALTADAAYALAGTRIFRRNDGVWEPVHEFAARMTGLAWSPRWEWFVAVGEKGRAEIWNPELGQWRPWSPPTERTLMAASLASDGSVWAVGTAGTWARRDYAWGWIDIATAFASAFTRICLVQPDRLLILGDYNDGIMFPWESLASFTVTPVLLTQPARPVALPPLAGPALQGIGTLHDAWSPAPGSGIVVGEDGAMKLQDGEWSLLAGGAGFAVHGRSLDDFWIGGWQAKHRRDGEWAEAVDVPGAALGIRVAPDGTLFICSQDGVLRLSGGEWVLEHGGTWLRLWGGSNGEMLAVGHGGRIAHRRDGAWHDEVSGTSALLVGVWGRDPGPGGGAVREAWAVGHRTLLRYDGTRWAPAPLPAGAERLFLNDVCGDRDGGIWIVTAGGGLFSHFSYPLD